MAPLTALYDACVLYPAPLRDLLMHLALTGLFRARWTSEIHNEWMRHVLANRPDVAPAALQRTRQLMDAHMLEALVTDYEPLIPPLTLPDPDDRHVLAAAIQGQATLIVTYNLSDFPTAALQPHGLVAEHPDAFVLRLLTLDPDAVCLAARRQRQFLKSPPKTVAEFLKTLEQQRLPQTVARLRHLADAL